MMVMCTSTLQSRTNEVYERSRLKVVCGGGGGDGQQQYQYSEKMCSAASDDDQNFRDLFSC